MKITEERFAIWCCLGVSFKNEPSKKLAVWLLKRKTSSSAVILFKIGNRKKTSRHAALAKLKLSKTLRKRGGRINWTQLSNQAILVHQERGGSQLSTCENNKTEFVQEDILEFRSGTMDVRRSKLLPHWFDTQFVLVLVFTGQSSLWSARIGWEDNA